MSFRSSAAFAKATSGGNPKAIALVTGAKSGIGKSIAKKLASFSFIDEVFAVSRSIKSEDVASISPKMTALAADVTSEEGRNAIVEAVQRACGGVGDERCKQLRFLVHSAGTIDPIGPVNKVTPEQFRHAMAVNCEGPLFRTTALYDCMTPLSTAVEDDEQAAGRVLHVSSGAAHGAPPVGWSVYGITKAAFFQSFKVLEREYRERYGGKVVVGSFKPGVVDTSMQGTIRDSSKEEMPIVGAFQQMKEKAGDSDGLKARPPPKGALDSPENVAFFAEYLLIGTTDEEFGNKDDPSEYDIRNESLYPLWIPEENLPKST